LTAFYANENFPLPVVEELRRLGHDVLTTNDANRSGQAVPDAEVIDYAIGEGRAVLTLNRKHFIALHRDRGSHAGIVVCTVDRDFIGQARRIHEQVAARRDLAGELVRVNRPN
jgi:Domain of unknown function (DUF5615)